MATAFPVIFGVELGDYGETKDDLVFMFGMSVEPDKVVDNLPVGLTCVGLIDGRIHVLDVDDKGVNVWGDFLQVMARYVQTCLHRKLPSIRTLFAKLLYEQTMQEWFASTKAYASSRSKEVEIVHLHVRHQQFCIHLLPYAVSIKALGIERQYLQ